MKSYIISENRDSMLGLKLAGISGFYSLDPTEIEKAFKKAFKDPEIGIIYLTEKAFYMVEEQVTEAKKNSMLPLITVIPDRHGYHNQKGIISHYIEESLGL